MGAYTSAWIVFIVVIFVLAFFSGSHPSWQKEFNSNASDESILRSSFLLPYRLFIVLPLRAFVSIGELVQFMAGMFLSMAMIFLVLWMLFLGTLILSLPFLCFGTLLLVKWWS